VEVADVSTHVPIVVDRLAGACSDRNRIVVRALSAPGTPIDHDVRWPRSAGRDPGGRLPAAQ
jgi:hypothetical protein